MKEPVMVIVAGGLTLIQAVIQLLIAFNIPVSANQQAAILGVAGILLPLISRQLVTPMATLPAGVAAKIADGNTAKG